MDASQHWNLLFLTLTNKLALINNRLIFSLILWCNIEISSDVLRRITNFNNPRKIIEESNKIVTNTHSQKDDEESLQLTSHGEEIEKVIIVGCSNLLIVFDIEVEIDLDVKVNVELDFEVKCEVEVSEV